MNKALLIVICDFLLLSLLSLAKFDMTGGSNAPVQPQSQTAVDTQDVESDLVDVLSKSLEEEQESRRRLIEELDRTRDTLKTREKLLADRQREMQRVQDELRKRESETQRLAEEHQSLSQQFNASQENIERLREQLTATSVEAIVSKERLALIQDELRKRELEASKMADQMAQLEVMRRETEAAKNELNTRLQVSETEKRIAREQIDHLHSEMQIVRDEKARIQEHATKLADGLTDLSEKSEQIAEKSQEIAQQSEQLVAKTQELAAKSDELKEDIRQNRPLAPNNIFNDFVSNRLRADFVAVRSGFFGQEVTRQKETRTILVSDGTRTYALAHVDDTPLALQDPGTDWEWLTGNLRRHNSIIPIESIAFLAVDPRIVVVPLDDTEARSLNAKVYRPSSDPFRFQDAVVIGTDETYYGESAFQLDPETPQYLKMERSRLRGLFGKFQPSRGDLVFSKTGELLGVMVNNEYCAVLSNFYPARTIRTGMNITGQRTGQLLASLRHRVDRLPLPLR